MARGKGIGWPVDWVSLRLRTYKVTLFICTSHVEPSETSAMLTTTRATTTAGACWARLQAAHRGSPFQEKFWKVKVSLRPTMLEDWKRVLENDLRRSGGKREGGEVEEGSH